MARCKKCFSFFDKMQKVFLFFRQDAKNVLLSSTKCKKCLSFLTRCNEQSGISYLGTSFLLFFALLSMQKKSRFLTCVQVRSGKLGCILFIFEWFTLNFSSTLIVEIKLRKLINYKERNKYQKSAIYKNI